MINLLLLLLFLACLATATAWIAENPGDVTIHWFDYRIDTSFAFLLLLAVVAAFALAYAYVLIRRLIYAPEYFSQQRTLKHYKRGLTELTYSVAALAAADTKEALTHTRKAEKLLGRTPLTLLLAAQIARSQGDDAKTRTLLEQMLNHEETEYLAARSLSDAASKQHLFPKALSLAQRAQALNPNSIAQVLSLHIRLGQWQEAMLAIDKSVRKGTISRSAMRHYKGIVYLQQGLQLQDTGSADGALLAAKQCLRHAPDFVPCVVFAAKIFAERGQERKAIKFVMNAWKTEPHPQLAQALRTITASQPKEKQQALFMKLTAIHPEPAATDAAWACSSCGQAAPAWDAHCPACEAFDTLEWKKREIKFAA